MSIVVICVLLALQPVIFASSCDKTGESVSPFGYELLETRLERLESIFIYRSVDGAPIVHYQLTDGFTYFRRILQLSEQMNDLGGKMDQILKIHDSKDKKDIVLKPAEQSSSNNSDVNLEDPCKAANQSGLYQLQLPERDPKAVYCEADTFGGGWLVVQQRLDGSTDFDRTWAEYRAGFGTVGNGTEFWLGLEAIHRLVSRAVDYELAVELKDHDGKYGFARFSDFKVAGEDQKYKLVGVGRYEGTIGDQLGYSLGRGFSTGDSDNDIWSDGSCAKKYSGGWWYGHCAYSFLNGLFSKDTSTGYGMAWAPWTSAARYSRMMIRRKN